MANPYVIQGAISALLGGGQLLAGALMHPKRPTYNMPSEIGQNQQLAKNLYGASTLYGLPGQGAIYNQNQSALATALRNYQNSQQNPAAMLAGINATTGNQMKTNADIGVKAAQFRQANMNTAASRLSAANKDVASFRDKEFQLNELAPFQAKVNTKSSLIGGGLQNLSSGATTLGSAKYRQAMDDKFLTALSKS